MTKQPRFVVLGTGGEFTFHVLKTLIDKSFMPLAYINSGDKPASKSARFADINIEVFSPGNGLDDLLKLNSTPGYFQSSINMENIIAQFKTDFLLVACWPQLLSEKITGLASCSAVNLHPSLLPEYRGYDPISEQLAKGNTNFGVTLHLLSNHFDQGDIVLQQGFPIQQNPSVHSINEKAAIIGAQLFIQAVETYHHPGWSLTKQK